MEKLSRSRIFILNNFTLQMSREQQAGGSVRGHPSPPPSPPALTAALKL